MVVMQPHAEKAREVIALHGVSILAAHQFGEHDVVPVLQVQELHKTCE